MFLSRNCSCAPAAVACSWGLSITRVDPLRFRHGVYLLSLNRWVFPVFSDALSIWHCEKQPQICSICLNMEERGQKYTVHIKDLSSNSGVIRTDQRVRSTMSISFHGFTFHDWDRFIVIPSVVLDVSLTWPSFPWMIPVIYTLLETLRLHWWSSGLAGIFPFLPPVFLVWLNVKSGYVMGSSTLNVFCILPVDLWLPHWR